VVLAAYRVINYIKTIRVMSIIGIIYFGIRLLVLVNLYPNNPIVTAGAITSTLYGLILSIVGVVHTGKKKQPL
jgi:hypothetical protein